MHQNTIAIAFDCDETLTDCTTSGLIRSLGVAVKEFWEKRVARHCDSGWDPITAYLYEMVLLSQESPDTRITQERLAAWGKEVTFFPGVEEVFDLLKESLSELNPDLNIEFYMVSSGIGEILRHTSIAKHFKDLWACDFHYGEDGGILFPKNVVSFTDKTRYLFQITKGIVGSRYRKRPFEVNRRVPDEHLHVPFSQMIYVGDGSTDVPCFSLVKKFGGYPFAVFHPVDRSRWAKSWGFVDDQRVSNLHKADFRADSDLVLSLKMAIEAIAKRIDLRSQMYA